MRRLFGVLRTEGESVSLAPQPGLGELERLVRQVGPGDLHVRLRVEGEPVPLSPGVDLAAYRIAQEGLTNAATPLPPRARRRSLVRYGRSGSTSRSRTTAAACGEPERRARPGRDCASGSRCTTAPSTWAPRRAAESGSPCSLPLEEAT